MLLAEIPAEGWSIIIAALCVGISGIATNVITLVLNYYAEQARIKREAEAAKKVEVVRLQALETTTVQAETAATQSKKLADIAKVGKRTELYCNSALGRALRLAAVATAAQAAISKDPTAMAAAEAAAKELHDHEAKQTLADLEDATEGESPVA